jgi:hypothetical protein
MNNGGAGMNHNGTAMHNGTGMNNNGTGMNGSNRKNASGSQQIACRPAGL